MVTRTMKNTRFKYNKKLLTKFMNRCQFSKSMYYFKRWKISKRKMRTCNIFIQVFGRFFAIPIFVYARVYPILDWVALPPMFRYSINQVVLTLVIGLVQTRGKTGKGVASVSYSSYIFDIRFSWFSSYSAWKTSSSIFQLYTGVYDIS